MYNDSLKTANRIISDTDLIDIFNKMYEEIEKNKKIFKQEEILNSRYEFKYQTWTLQHFEGSLTFNVDFLDNTSITFDKYHNFLPVFNNRLDEIKAIQVYYKMNYYTKERGEESVRYFNMIEMSITDARMNTRVSINSEDKKMNDVFQLIKNKILNAPEKYDKTMKNKSSIISKVGFAFGMIASLILTTALLFIPVIREIYRSGYIIYPLATIILGYAIGITFCTSEINYFYDILMPEKKFSHISNNDLIYKDDIDSYTSSCDILIGRKSDGIKMRQKIEELSNRSSKLIPIELVITLVISIIVIFL